MSTNAAHLTVVTPNFVPSVPQVTKYIVINAGLTIVADGQILSLRDVARLFHFCYAPQEENLDLRAHITPYNKKIHAAIKNRKPLPANIPVYII